MNIVTLLSNPIVNLVLGIVAGGVLGGYFYLKGKRDKEPHWAIQTVNLFKDYSGTVAGLDIQYLGEKVRDLSVSKVALWNHGAMTINSSDLVRVDPLRLQTKGKARILSTKLISANNEASQVLLSASSEKDQAFFNFEYLDHGQGFVIQVIHEGTNSNDLELKGAIKGVGRIRKIDPSIFVVKSKEAHLTDIRLGVLGAIVLLALCGITAWLVDIWQWKAAAVVPVLFGTLGLLLLFAIIIDAVGLGLHMRRQVPKGLESFYADPRQLADPSPTLG